jgi:hypothetical protein
MKSRFSARNNENLAIEGSTKLNGTNEIVIRHLIIVIRRTIVHAVDALEVASVRDLNKHDYFSSLAVLL